MKALALAVGLVLAALTYASAPASAQADCRQIPPWPSFAEVGGSARSIVLVKVIDSVDGVARKARSIDVLKGSSPENIDLGGLRPGRKSVDCVGGTGLHARVGDRLVIAFEGTEAGRAGRIDAVAHVGRMRDRRNISGLERLTSKQANAFNASEPDGLVLDIPPDDPEPQRSFLDDLLDGLAGIGRAVRSPANEAPPDSSEPLWSCGGEQPGFPRAALAGPTGVEKFEGLVYDGLRSAIETMKSEFRFDPRGDRPHKLPWLLAYEGDDEALFLVRRRGTPERYSSMHVGREGRTWGFDGYSDSCRVRPLVTHGMGGSEWRVEDGTSPTADATSVRAEVHERSCASGQTATGRIADPLLEYGEDAIVITIPVRQVDARFVTCQGNPRTPFVIELAEPIGDRLLLDGGPWPPEQRWPTDSH
jgi:hypothetical protein